MTTPAESARYHKGYYLTPGADPTGTCYAGTIKATYDQLVEALGEPHYTDGDKTNCEWAFRVQAPLRGNEFVMTIYSWKPTAPKEAITTWNVGAHDHAHDAALTAARAMPARYKATWI